MSFEKAVRKNIPLKVLLSGPSGSGKTYSALLFARGLVGPKGRIAVLDTENRSSEAYDHLTEFFVDSLTPNNDKRFTVDMYLKAMKEAEKEGFDVLIIDSITPEWESLLDEKNERDRLPKANSFTNFADVTKKHNKFTTAILQSPLHIIACCKSKACYEQVEDNGRKRVQKLGLAPIQRDGIEFEFYLHIALDKAYITIDKNREVLNPDKWEGKKITTETGSDAAEWLSKAPKAVFSKAIVAEMEHGKPLPEVVATSEDEVAGEQVAVEAPNPSELPAIARESIAKILNTTEVGATRDDKIAFMALVDSVLPYAVNSDFDALEAKVLELGFAPDGAIMKRITAKKAGV